MKAPYEIFPTATMSDNTYNRLKWVAQYFLPALGTLYFTLAGIWNLPRAEEILGTLAAITIFLSVMLGLTSAKYDANPENYDGQLLIDESPEATEKWLFSSQRPLDDLRMLKTARFAITRVGNND